MLAPRRSRRELPAEPRPQRPEAGMLAPLVEVRLEDVRHGHRFAPMPRDPPPVVKCGHDLSTPHRRPPRSCPRSPRSPSWASCSPAAAARARPAPSRAPRAPTGAPPRPSRPRPSRSSTPTSTRSPTPGSGCWRSGARFPSWPKLVAEFDKAANEATDGGPDARAGALLARLRGRGRRARRSGRRLRSDGARVRRGTRQEQHSRGRSRRRRT